MSEEIQRKAVEEGSFDDEPDACENFLKQHRLQIVVHDNRRYRHNESKLLREPKFVATLTGFFTDGYGDTEEEAIQDFKKRYNHLKKEEMRNPR